MAENIKSFGEQIRQLRENAGYPQRKIAAQLDIDPSILGKIERNERQPNREQIRKLAKIFNQDEHQLFKEYLSDQIANRILDEHGSIDVLKVVEEKIIYLKSKRNVRK